MSTETTDRARDEIAGRDRGFGPKVRAGISAAVGRSYRESMRKFALMGNMDLCTRGSASTSSGVNSRPPRLPRRSSG